MPKVLILAPTFFPDPAVSGIRVTQWARHLAEFGWTPLVLCRHHGHPATPKMLAESVHPAVQIEYFKPFAARSNEPISQAGFKSKLKKQLAQMVGQFAVPDPLVWKWKNLRGQAVEVARRWQPDVVLSSSPPHSIHLLGRTVARAVNVPWVADFRDPYLIDSRYGLHGIKRLFAAQHRRFERDIYRDAALCTHAIPFHGRWASRRYDFARPKIRILTNGFPAELTDEQFLQSAERSSRASIRAVGILGEGAVATISTALRELSKRGIDAEFRHVGRARDAAESIPADLRDRVILRGTVSHREALRELAGADVLLKYDDLNRAKVNGLSSKLFEYLALGRPIVAINPTRPDWQLLRRLPWCSCLDDPQPAAITTAIEQAIATRAKPDEGWLKTFRERYNRRNQTEQLAGWLDQIVG